MNSDIDFMGVSEKDKAFVKIFEDFLNGTVCNPEKTGAAMTTMHRYLQSQAWRVVMGFIKALAYNYQRGRFDDRNETASHAAAEAYSQLIESGCYYDPSYEELTQTR